MKTPQQDYWRNPRKYVAGLAEVGDSYIECSKPEWYAGFDMLSRYLTEIIYAYYEPTRILELGCGPGRNLQRLFELGYEPTGVEINPEALLVAKARFPDIVDCIRIQTVEDYLLQGIDFPVIFTSGLLMHLPKESESFFGRIVRHCKRYLIVNEVEAGFGSDIRFIRNYREVFEDLGMTQVAKIKGVRVPGSVTATLRVFKQHGT